MSTKRAPRLAVVGAGNGGLAIAATAAAAGCRVRLHDIDQAVVEPIAAAGVLTLLGQRGGTVSIDVATTDIAAVVDGADMIVVVVPGPAHRAAAEALRPHAQRGQVVVVVPGCTGGALEVATALGAATAGVTVAEADAFPYACSKPAPTTTAITATKAIVGIGALPARAADSVVAAVALFLPQARALPTVLHTSLSNVNPVLHVPPMLANIGWIESGARFDFYADGITRAVAQVVAGYDAERVAVATALGVSVQPLLQWVEETYAIASDDVYRAVQALHRDVYGPMPAPHTLDHRYLVEDVPCGTVPTSSLGSEVGVDTPIHDAMIEIASRVCREDFSTTGTTAEKLGLSNVGAAGIAARVSA